MSEDKKTTTQNTAESNESVDVKPTEAGKASDKSIDNATETKKSTNEPTKAEPTKAQADTKKDEIPTSGTAVVRYVGSSIWQDEKKAYWSKSDLGEEILSERQYPASEYKDRKDLQFMVGYGEMQVSFTK